MTVNPLPRKLSDEEQKLVQEYLENGGVVNKKPAGERSESIEYTGGFYAKRRKKKEESDN